MDEMGRRFATILAADAVASSWLTSGDDPEVARAAAACLVLAKRVIGEQGGLAFDRGDRALVAEFPHVAGAVRAAVAIQQAISRFDADPAFERHALLRIGLSVGDVDEAAAGLEGEGVDLASGLAALAVAGGICLPHSVYEHVRHRVHVGFQYSGEKKIRGVTDPVAIDQIVEPGVERGYFSFWEELRRRSVFRVGAAYAVVAWLLVQAANIALPGFGSPRQTFIAVAILGFPVGLVLAWLYELTPMGLKRSDEVLRQVNSSSLIGKRLNVAIMALLVIAVVVLIVENYVFTDQPGSAAAGPDSIAVLAFENFSPDPNDE